MAHEKGEPKNFLIFVVGLGSVVTLTAVMYGLQSYYAVLRDGEQQGKVLGRKNPELVDMRADEERRLTSYAILEPGAAGKVRIPIDRAMTLLAQRGRDGVPAIRPAPEADAALTGGAAPAASASAAASPAPSSAVPAASASAAASPASSAPATQKGR